MGDDSKRNSYTDSNMLRSGNSMLSKASRLGYEERKSNLDQSDKSGNTGKTLSFDNALEPSDAKSFLRDLENTKSDSSIGLDLNDALLENYSRFVPNEEKTRIFKIDILRTEFRDKPDPDIVNFLMANEF